MSFVELIKTKTFWGGVAFALFGISGFATNQFDANVAITHVLVGWGLISGRDAVKKLEVEYE